MSIEAAATHLNTLNYAALLESFERVVAQHGGVVERGLRPDYQLALEDGVPWFEVVMRGKRSGAKAKAMVKDLARAMNIQIVHNRTEGETDCWTTMGCFDIDPKRCATHPFRPIRATPTRRNSWTTSGLRSCHNDNVESHP